MPIDFIIDDLGPITDFRARPNTPEYMAIYDQPGRRDPWPRFGYPRPGNESLSEFVENVAQVGISRAVFTGRQGSLAGECPIPNDYIADCVGQFPQRLAGFAGIDPLIGDAALVEVRRAITDLKLSGIAIDPPRQLPGEAIGYDNEKHLFPVYELAQNLDVPVVLTMGPMVAQFGDPWPVDRVATTFPNLKIVCSHGCWPQVTELISLAYRRSNVYLEASIYEFLPGAEPFIDAAATIISDQVLYASAFPFNPLRTLEKFLQFPIPFEAMKKIVSENATRLLGPISATTDVVTAAVKASR
ncbi:amidohydrolase family protein [Rhodococcus globerulus]|uniref:amidohydrolase family protein n=1 Tax=Rhodococcus globerulus TaxID=33008 RepID=UPI001C59A294|nr:amidohydrolase family protein [Rhodococcus globerulus]QXW01323.1 amidohydrolase family protein [Rhodococcus globerulus]